MLGGLWLQYEQLDEQHKGLFQAVFKCAEGRSDCGALSGLLAACKAHFETEEVGKAMLCFLSFTVCRFISADFSKRYSVLMQLPSRSQSLFTQSPLQSHLGRARRRLSRRESHCLQWDAPRSPLPPKTADFPSTISNPI